MSFRSIPPEYEIGLQWYGKVHMICNHPRRVINLWESHGYSRMLLIADISSRELQKQRSGKISFRVHCKFSSPVSLTGALSVYKKKLVHGKRAGEEYGPTSRQIYFCNAFLKKWRSMITSRPGPVSLKA